MSWHILGAGSIGCLWASRLAHANIPVRLILRNNAQLNKYKLINRISLSQNNQTTHYKVPAEIAQQLNLPPIRRLLLACKAYDAEKAVRQLSHRLDKNSELILIQNGLGSQDLVRSNTPESRCILASTTEGAFMKKEFHVTFSGKGMTWLGDPQHNSAPSWLKELTLSQIPHQWTSEILSRQWLKWALNCAINPLTVIKNVPNGALLEDKHYLKILCDELTLILKAHGYLLPKVNIYQETLKVLKATAHNFSSMHQDIAQKKPTEINFLLQKAIDFSYEKQLTTPSLIDLNHKLLLHIKNNNTPSYL
ncbi:UNVERIFIED_CONTAM: hypothetical protein GTU68_053910 [Idotea baltica]|nr:hypothetical protein [Idotea baltica]